MPDATISAADVIGKTLYAGNSPVTLYAYDLKTPLYTVGANQLIGEVYSWIEPVSGGLYWMIYKTPSDYSNMIASYVKHDPSKLSLPALPDILQKIADKKKQEEKDTKGLLQYYLDHYGAWIVGGIVVAVALPAVVRSARTATAKKISGTEDDKKKGLLLLLLIGGGVVVAQATKKKKYKGTIIIDPLDKGEFVPDVVDSPIYIDSTQYPQTFAGVKRRTVPLLTQ